MPVKKDKNLGEATVDSINQVQARLEAINADIKKAEDRNAFLTIEGESIQKNIDFLNGNLEKRKQETKDFEENYKIRLSNLTGLDEQIKIKEVELIELERTSTNEIKQEISNLSAELKKLETQKENLLNELTVLGKNIIQKSDEARASAETNRLLEIKKNDLQSLIKGETEKAQEVVADTDKKKNQLSSYNVKLKEIQEKIEKYEKEYSVMLNTEKELNKVLVQLGKDIEKAQTEFDKISKKSKVLIDRTEFQNGQEAYLKEQFEKIGREYQPYQE